MQISSFKQLAWLPAILILLNLQSCIMVPGSNIDLSSVDAPDSEANFFERNDAVWFPGFSNSDEAQSEEQVEAMVDRVDLVTITSRLISELQRQEEQSIVAAAMSTEMLDAVANYEYYVGRGDILSITIYDHPELTNPSGSNNRSAEDSGNAVENDGTIYYPYVGKVQVDGLTVDEIRELLASRLAEFITDPQVAVRVIRFNSKRAYVTGQVNEPGPQPITNVPITVLDAIADAGGLAENANWHEVLLSRNGEDIRVSVYEMLNNGRLGQNMLLQHGDVLHVPVSGQQQVLVLGELNHVNALPMGNMRMSLTEALTRSGGLNQVTSNAEGIFVIRSNSPDADKLATIYQLDVRNAIAFAVGAQFMLEPADIVYVTTAPVTRLNRVISQIIPSLNALITADRVGTL